jgi:hypothetical protein
MKDGILLLFLALLIGAWITLYAKRTKEKKRLQKDTKEILLERFKDAVMSSRHDGQKVVGTEEISDLLQKIKGSRKRIYPYHQKEYRSGKERRKSRVPVGITFEFVDRRQRNDPYYSGPERRSGMDRRGKIWDRRKPLAFQYS